MLQKERNRKGHFDDKATKHSIRVIIEALWKQLESTEQKIKERLNKNEELRAKAKVINREIAALAGLAPYVNDSGKTSKRRRTSAGRPIVKRMPFMCAMVAIRNNKDLKVFYEKLTNNGKLKIIAIIAVMRKSIVANSFTLIKLMRINKRISLQAEFTHESFYRGAATLSYSLHFSMKNFEFRQSLQQHISRHILSLSLSLSLTPNPLFKTTFFKVPSSQE